MLLLMKTDDQNKGIFMYNEMQNIWYREVHGYVHKIWTPNTSHSEHALISILSKR